MVEECKFYFQHSISIVDGNLLLFNNGILEMGSSIMELKIDELKREVKLVKKLELPYYSPSYGEVIKLSNGNYLVQRGNSIDLDVPEE